MLDDVKLLLGITSTEKDSLLNLLINLCKDDCKMITGAEEIENFASVIIKMVLFQYNRLGTEGLNSESYSGVSYNYSSDYPDYILNQLKSKGRFYTL